MNVIIVLLVVQKINMMCEKLGIFKLGNTTSQKSLCWYGNVARSNDWINQCRKIESAGPSRRERYNTWYGTVKEEELIKGNLHKAYVFGKQKTERNRSLQLQTTPLNNIRAI